MVKIEKKHFGALRWMGSVTGRAKGYIVLLSCMQGVLGIFGVLYAMQFRKIVNAAVDGEKGLFFRSALVYAGIVVFQIALRTVSRYLAEYVGATVENRFKKRLFSVLLTKDYAYVTSVHSGEWMNRLTTDTAIVAGTAVQLLPSLIGLFVQLAGAVVAIAILEWRLLCVLIPGGLLFSAFTYVFRKALKRLHKDIREADGKLRVFLQERLGSMLIIRTFAQERRTIEQSEELLGSYRKVRMKRTRFSSLCGLGFSAASSGAYLIGLVFCSYGILTHTMSYGDLTAILQLASQIKGPFVNMSGVFSRYYAMLASAERLMEVEALEEDVQTEAVSEEERMRFYREHFAGIRLEDVSFTYQPPVRSEKDAPEMPVVLEGLNLEIRKGEYVAFTGPSGCGKSTVLKLMMSLYPLDSGRRCLLTTDGTLPLDASWRGLFAYVPQGNQLMSGTVREIIAFGDPEQMKQEERLRRALQIACADQFVDHLEQGLDTLLGERGAGLSEGQMQRLAIARAIFSDHPILLLDEATGSLDEATEAKLLANLRAMTDKTVVIVTHRPAALAVVDKKIGFE